MLIIYVMISLNILMIFNFKNKALNKYIISNNCYTSKEKINNLKKNNNI